MVSITIYCNESAVLPISPGARLKLACVSEANEKFTSENNNIRMTNVVSDANQCSRANIIMIKIPYRAGIETK